jgi:HPt (histidine-containing phosphotransfer) domain-containing protein
MTSSEAEPALFDRAAIEQLRHLAGDQGGTFVSEMAQLFRDETRKSLAELRKSCEAGDWKQVARLAHSVKSSAATLGLMRLSAACRALELHTHDHAPGDRTVDLVATVFNQFEQAVPILEGLS